MCSDGAGQEHGSLQPGGTRPSGGEVGGWGTWDGCHPQGRRQEVVSGGLGGERGGL